jgi:hypothetical protein
MGIPETTMQGAWVGIPETTMQGTQPGITINAMQVIIEKMANAYLTKQTQAVTQMEI